MLKARPIANQGEKSKKHCVGATFWGVRFVLGLRVVMGRKGKLEESPWTRRAQSDPNLKGAGVLSQFISCIFNKLVHRKYRDQRDFENGALAGPQ